MPATAERLVATLRARLGPGAEGRRIAGIALRVLAGVGGGYGVAALATMVLSLGLPLGLSMPRAEAVLAATMASFAIHTAAIVWAFSASLPRALGGIGGAVLALALVLFLLQGPPA